MSTTEDLIAEARARDLWLRSHYQDIWFHPDELEAERAEGRFRWGPANWELRDPMDHLRQLQDEVKAAQKRVDDFARRI